MGDVVPRQTDNDRLLIQDTSKFIDIQKLSPYDFVEATYHGSEGYRDGRYLIPHPRETFYNTRRLNSYFKNFFRSIINAMIDPVYNSHIDRDIESNPAYSAFVDNADNAGTPFNDILKNAMVYARMHGVSFVVMDNYAPDGMPDTQIDAVTNRILPYVYTRRVQDVYEYHVDRFGKLQDITFFDGTTKEGGKTYQLYRKWTATEWALYKRLAGADSVEPVLIESGIHGLGVLPVVPVLDFVVTNSLEKLPDPPLYEIARLNFALYNLESEIRMMEQTQCFSVFYCSGVNAESVSLGVHNGLFLPEGTTLAPGYASPDAQHIVNLVSNAQKLRDDIYLIAQRNGVIGVQSSQSGVSKEWDFRAEESVILNTMRASQKLEKRIAELFTLYSKIAVEYDPKYQDHYNPTYSQDRIAQGLQIIDRQPPLPVQNAIWKDIAIQYWSGNEEEKAAIVEMLDVETADTMQGKIQDGMAAGSMQDDAENYDTAPDFK